MVCWLKNQKLQQVVSHLLLQKVKEEENLLIYMLQKIYILLVSTISTKEKKTKPCLLCSC